jgi:hypothetical protein
MAKAKITLTDNEDKSLSVEVEFDPPLNPQAIVEDFSGAVATALYLIDVLKAERTSDEE